MSTPVFAITGRGNETKKAKDLIASIGGVLTAREQDANYLVVVRGAGRRKVEAYCRSPSLGQLLLLDMLEAWHLAGHPPTRPNVTMEELNHLQLFGRAEEETRRSYEVPPDFLKRRQVTMGADGVLLDEADNAVLLHTRQRPLPVQGTAPTVGFLHRRLLLDGESPPQKRTRHADVPPPETMATKNPITHSNTHSNGAPTSGSSVVANPMREAFRQRPKPDWETFFSDPAPVSVELEKAKEPSTPSPVPPERDGRSGKVVSHRISINRVVPGAPKAGTAVIKERKNGLEMTFDFTKPRSVPRSQSVPSQDQNRTQSFNTTRNNSNSIGGGGGGGTNHSSHPNNRNSNGGKSGHSGTDSQGMETGRLVEKKTEDTQRRPPLSRVTTGGAVTHARPPLASSSSSAATTATATVAAAATNVAAVQKKPPVVRGRWSHRPSPAHSKTTGRSASVGAPTTNPAVTSTSSTAASHAGTTSNGRKTTGIGAFPAQSSISRPNATRRSAPNPNDAPDSLLQRVRRSPYCSGLSDDTCTSILHQIVDRACPVSFDAIAGLAVCKRILQEAIILPAKCPQLFTGLRRPCSGLLLFGPPGNGKTLLAKAVARECGTTFFSISAAAITSKWVGESEKMVRALFGVARALSPSTVFVDEIDALLQARGGQNEGEGSRRLKTEFLVQMDGAGNDHHEARVLVMGATNRPFDLDEAIIRRFPKRVFVPLPDQEARSQILQTLLNTDETPNHFTAAAWERIVTLTEGYSGHDLRQLCEEAAMIPVRELLEEKLRNGEDLTAQAGRDVLRPLTLQDVEGCVSTRKPSCCQKQLQTLEEWNNTYGSR